MLQRRQLTVATGAIEILRLDAYNVKLVRSWVSPILLLNGNYKLIASTSTAFQEKSNVFISNT